MDAQRIAVRELEDEFKFTIVADPIDELVAIMAFDDGRTYRLQHPGALASVRIFDETQGLDARCLEFFCKNCALPNGGGATKLDLANMKLREAHELWTPLSWRFLRWGNGICPQEVRQPTKSD